MQQEIDAADAADAAEAKAEAASEAASGHGSATDGATGADEDPMKALQDAIKQDSGKK